MMKGPSEGEMVIMIQSLCILHDTLSTRHLVPLVHKTFLKSFHILPVLVGIIRIVNKLII